MINQTCNRGYANFVLGHTKYEQNKLYSSHGTVLYCRIYAAKLLNRVGEINEVSIYWTIAVTNSVCAGRSDRRVRGRFVWATRVSRKRACLKFNHLTRLWRLTERNLQFKTVKKNNAYHA